MLRTRRTTLKYLQYVVPLAHYLHPRYSLLNILSKEEEKDYLGGKVSNAHGGQH